MVGLGVNGGDADMNFTAFTYNSYNWPCPILFFCNSTISTKFYWLFISVINSDKWNSMQIITKTFLGHAFCRKITEHALIERVFYSFSYFPLVYSGSHCAYCSILSYYPIKFRVT